MTNPTMITQRSVTGALILVNGTQIKSFCKSQPSVEVSTYRSELVAGRIGVELAEEYKYVFCMLGCEIDGPARLLRDNRGMIHSCAIIQFSN